MLKRNNDGEAFCSESAGGYQSLTRCERLMALSHPTCICSPLSLSLSSHSAVPPRETPADWRLSMTRAGFQDRRCRLRSAKPDTPSGQKSQNLNAHTYSTHGCRCVCAYECILRQTRLSLLCFSFLPGYGQYRPAVGPGQKLGSGRGGERRGRPQSTRRANINECAVTTTTPARKKMGKLQCWEGKKGTNRVGGALHLRIGASSLAAPALLAFVHACLLSLLILCTVYGEASLLWPAFLPAPICDRFRPPSQQNTPAPAPTSLGPGVEPSLSRLWSFMSGTTASTTLA